MLIYIHCLGGKLKVVSRINEFVVFPNIISYLCSTWNIEGWLNSLLGFGRNCHAPLKMYFGSYRLFF